MTIRWLLSYALYWMGDAVSYLTRRPIGDYVEWPYRLYSWLMNLSVNVQGDCAGPWKPAPTYGEDGKVTGERK